MYQSLKWGFWREQLHPWTGALYTLTDSLLITGNGVISSLSALEEGSYIVRKFHVPSLKWDFNESQVGFQTSALHTSTVFKHDSTNQRLQNQASKGNLVLHENCEFLNTSKLSVVAEKLSWQYYSVSGWAIQTALISQQLKPIYVYPPEYPPITELLFGPEEKLKNLFPYSSPPINMGNQIIRPAGIFP